jgi:hypothetical protein
MDRNEPFAPMGAMPEEIHRALYGAPAPTTEPEATQNDPAQPEILNPWSPRTPNDERIEYESDERQEGLLDENPVIRLFRGEKITSTAQEVPRFRLSKSSPTPASEKAAGELTYKTRKDENGFTWAEGCDADGVVKSARLIYDPEEIALAKKAPPDAEPVSGTLLAMLRQVIRTIPAQTANETEESFLARFNAELARLGARPVLSNPT